VPRGLAGAIIFVSYTDAPASAATWNLNATFSDGGTLSGTFDVDGVASTVTNCRIAAALRSGRRT